MADIIEISGVVAICMLELAEYSRTLQTARHTGRHLSLCCGNKKYQKPHFDQVTKVSITCDVFGGHTHTYV